jgi:hypothetical protein
MGTSHNDCAVGVSKLAQQRLQAEILKLPNEPIHRFSSLIIDEMSIREGLLYDRPTDRMFGLVATTEDVQQSSISSKPKLANKLLCFVLHGLSHKFTIPAAYFLSRSITGEDLHTLTISVIKEIESCGFFVLRIVTDNHRSNVALFKMLGDGTLSPRVKHPLRPKNDLLLSFDYCHVVKNIRSQFLEWDMADHTGVISSKYIKKIHDLQRNLTVKPVRFLTQKHLFPTNMEKMNVLRAVQVFSPPVTASIEYMMSHSERCNTTMNFSEAESTLRFMKFVYKFFSVHDVSDCVQSKRQKDPDKAVFRAVNDERLCWLKDEVPQYLKEVRYMCLVASHRDNTKKTTLKID